MTAVLDGRVVAIAGAGGGLGPVVAQALADAGATIAATDRDQAKLDAVGAMLGLGADRYDGQVVDLLDPDAVRAWADGIVERYGAAHGLLHLVGGWRGGSAIDEAPLEDWDFLHALLIRTVQHSTRAFRRHLIASGEGRFVLVSARQAQAPTHTNAAYAAAKAAAESWTLALADSFADTAATANIVVVNAIVTPQMRAENPDKPYTTFTDASEIADTLVWLCSDAARKVNGQRVGLHGR